MTTSALTEEELCSALSAVLLTPSSDFDEDLVPYLAGLIDSSEHTLHELAETGEGPTHELLGPFLESSGCDEDVISRAVGAVNELASSKLGGGGEGGGESTADATDSTSIGNAPTRKLRQGIVSMSSALDETSEHEADATRFLWGTDSGVAAYTNEQRDAHTSKQSAKEKRKAKQELEKARKEYEAKVRAMEEAEAKDAANGAAVSNMVLPDYTSGRNEKDIHCRNVSLALDSGRTLLDNGEIKFAHGRRYGLVGKNGVGKTTLLKAIASLSIEGFPRHHRILHVRQEIKAAGGDISVLRAVMEADVERNTLLAEEKELLKRLEASEGQENGTVEEDADNITKKRLQLQAKINDAAASDDSFAADLKRLDEVYARLSTLSADSAESRAATILSGLQFTPEMQAGPTSALSGGWRMRVSLAAALFIEPDLLMLDEPTNHLVST